MSVKADRLEAAYGSRTVLGPCSFSIEPGEAVALMGPAPIRSLAVIPAAQALVLGLFQPGERYGLIVVDGALLVGAICALALSEP